MRTRGVKIFDDNEDVLSPQLSDILQEISNGASLYWSILFIEGTSIPGQERSLIEYSCEINKSVNGVIVTWEELNNLSGRYFQVFETIILGCFNKKKLKRYKIENEMYIACDIVIELSDCTSGKYIQKIRI